MKKFLNKLNKNFNENFIETCFGVFTCITLVSLGLFVGNVITGVAAGAAIVLAGLGVVIAFTIKSRF